MKLYELCLYNRLKNKFFIEVYDSPYLLKKRIEKVRRSKKIEYSYLIKRF